MGRYCQKQSTSLSEVIYIHERLLNDHLCGHHRLGVPSKWWETSESFQLVRDIGLLLRRRRD